MKNKQQLLLMVQSLSCVFFLITVYHLMMDCTILFDDEMTKEKIKITKRKGFKKHRNYIFLIFGKILQLIFLVDLCQQSRKSYSWFANTGDLECSTEIQVNIDIQDIAKEMQIVQIQNLYILIFLCIFLITDITFFFKNRVKNVKDEENTSKKAMEMQQQFEFIESQSQQQQQKSGQQKSYNDFKQQQKMKDYSRRKKLKNYRSQQSFINTISNAIPVKDQVIQDDFWKNNQNSRQKRQQRNKSQIHALSTIHQLRMDDTIEMMSHIFPNQKKKAQTKKHFFTNQILIGLLGSDKNIRLQKCDNSLLQRDKEYSISAREFQKNYTRNQLEQSQNFKGERFKGKITSPMNRLIFPLQNTKLKKFTNPKKRANNHYGDDHDYKKRKYQKYSKQPKEVNTGIMETQRSLEGSIQQQQQTNYYTMTTQQDSSQRSLLVQTINTSEQSFQQCQYSQNNDYGFNYQYNQRRQSNQPPPIQPLNSKNAVLQIPMTPSYQSNLIYGNKPPQLENYEKDLVIFNESENQEENDQGSKSTQKQKKSSFKGKSSNSKRKMRLTKKKRRLQNYIRRQSENNKMKRSISQFNPYVAENRRIVEKKNSSIGGSKRIKTKSWKSLKKKVWQNIEKGSIQRSYL